MNKDQFGLKVWKRRDEKLTYDSVYYLENNYTFIEGFTSHWVSLVSWAIQCPNPDTLYLIESNSSQISTSDPVWLITGAINLVND